MIEAKLYRQIEQSIPIVTVDLVVTKNDCVLFVRRLNEPAKGQWWTPGGRILKDETPQVAATRKLLDETGLHLVFEKSCGIVNMPWKERHNITIVFKGELEDSTQIALNSESDKHIWQPINKLSNLNLHDYEKEVLETAGIRI